VKEIDWTLLARYLEGTCSAAERGVVDQWVASDPSRARELEELRRTWSRSATLPSSRRVAAMWRALASQMHEVDPKVHVGEGPMGYAGTHRPSPARILKLPEQRTTWRQRAVRGISATTVAAVVLTIVWPRGSAPVSNAPPASPREFVTARGERAAFNLADGSRMTLAAETRVLVPADYGVVTRELLLEGEALFEVVHDTTRPFRVRAKGAVVEDVGTRFDVRAYAEDSLVHVAVETGAVTLLGARSPSGAAARDASVPPHRTVLHAGEIGTVTRSGRVATSRAAPLGNYVSWADGRLEFAHVLLSDVVRAIGRWYDLDVQVEGEKLASERVTATFSVQSPSEMLGILALATGARVERRGRMVRLIPNQ
jgi:transmembrane sensor